MQVGAERGRETGAGWRSRWRALYLGGRPYDLRGVAECEKNLLPPRTRRFVASMIPPLHPG